MLTLSFLQVFSSMSMITCEIHERETVIKLAKNSFQPHEMGNQTYIYIYIYIYKDKLKLYL